MTWMKWREGQRWRFFAQGRERERVENEGEKEEKRGGEKYVCGMGESSK